MPSGGRNVRSCKRIPSVWPHSWRFLRDEPDLENYYGGVLGIGVVTRGEALQEMPFTA